MAVFGLIYGVFAYLLFLATMLYAIGFVGNLYVPKSIDVGGATALSTVITVDVLLLSLFAIQHSVMARPAFKRAWTRLVPPFLERSTYVLASDLVLIVLFWQWRAISTSIWSVYNGTIATMLRVVFFAGWALVVAATIMIDHFDLFGLRHIWLNFRGAAYTPPPFGTKWAYRYLRHPIMLGFLIAF